MSKTQESENAALLEELEESEYTDPDNLNEDDLKSEYLDKSRSEELEQEQREKYDSFLKGELAYDNVPDSPVGDAQGKWRLDYGEVLYNLKDRLLGVIRYINPKTKKVDFFEEETKLTNSEGASKFFTFILSRMHHGINLSVYEKEEISTLMDQLNKDMLEMVCINFNEWELNEENAATIMHMIEDNIQAICLRAKGGTELNYSYQAFKSQANYNMTAGEQPKQSGFFSSLVSPFKKQDNNNTNYPNESQDNDTYT